jgi:membrane fusion protein, multidrug efflux system
MDDQPTTPLEAPPLRDRTYPDEGRRADPDGGTDAPLLLEPPQGGRRSAWWLVLALLVVAGLAVWLVLRGGHESAVNRRFATTGPMPVGTAKVVQGNMPVQLSELGTVTPLATVTVQTQINGQLIDVGFKEGQMVKKGDFLAQIDPRPYQVALEQAQAQLAKDQAALADAEVDLARYKKLVAQNSIATQTLDTQVATVAQDKATIKADQAQIDTQKLNLTYCHIIAPVGGRVGLRQVDPGNYIQTTSTTGIVVITQLQPISVIFTLPEDSLPDVLERVHAGAKLPVTAYDRTGVKELDSGVLDTIDNQIDPTTGTVKLRATFNNPNLILFPNQFVNVQLLVNTLVNADIVPTAAIQRGEPGPFVYVVQPNHTVAVQKVTLGAGTSQDIAVTEGLKPGQLVVTDGADRLKDGAEVKISETTTAAGGVVPVKKPSGAAGQRRSGGQSGKPGQRRQQSGG